MQVAVQDQDLGPLLRLRMIGVNHFAVSRQNDEDCTRLRVATGGLKEIGRFRTCKFPYNIKQRQPFQL